MTDSSARLIEKVLGQISAITVGAPYESWRDSNSLKADDVVLINNSFLYREGLRTRKSELYLGFRAGHEEQVMVYRPQSGLNGGFRRLTDQKASSTESMSLDTAIRHAVDDFGLIAFSIVGRVGDRRGMSVSLSKVGTFDALEFDPSQTAVMDINNTTIRIGTFDSVDILWRELTNRTNDLGIELSDDAPQQFDGALAELQEQAGRVVDVGSISAGGPSILTEVLARITAQTEEYRGFLAAAPSQGPGSNTNEVLRISYNFADGAKSLLTLIVGLSDLKPLVFWLTSATQFDLADRFAQLPFSRVGKAKPSLDRYRNVIAAARNGVFHDVFGFGSNFTIALSNDAIRAPELTLFRDYSRRREAALQFKDRELVELLEDFTRASERQIPDGFWEKNLLVMEAMCELGAAINEALVLCHAAIDD